MRFDEGGRNSWLEFGIWLVLVLGLDLHFAVWVSVLQSTLTSFCQHVVRVGEGQGWRDLSRISTACTVLDFLWVTGDEFWGSR